MSYSRLSDEKASESLRQLAEALVNNYPPKSLDHSYSFSSGPNPSDQFAVLMEGLSYIGDGKLAKQLVDSTMKLSVFAPAPGVAAAITKAAVAFGWDLLHPLVSQSKLVFRFRFFLIPSI